MKKSIIYISTFLLFNILVTMSGCSVYEMEDVQDDSSIVEDDNDAKDNSITGDVSTVDGFYSPELNNDKTIRIYLPDDYNTSDKSYPVIYMHDGQNLFSTKTASYKKEWNMDETLSELFKEGKTSGAIVVGIDSSGDTRVDEYNPFKGSTASGLKSSGKGNLYAEFIVDTLKPYIDKNYRTLKDKKNTAIIGSSYGGVIALYTGIEYSDTFGMIGSFSLCDNINPEEMESYLKSNFTEDKMKDTKIYFYAGVNDFAHDSCKKAYEEGYDNGVKQITFEEDDGIHDETSWSKKVYSSLKYFELCK